jgi:hypothetical protein
MHYSLTRYKACGTLNYVTNAYCDETIIYNDPVNLEATSLKC